MKPPNFSFTKLRIIARTRGFRKARFYVIFYLIYFLVSVYVLTFIGNVGGRGPSFRTNVKMYLFLFAFAIPLVVLIRRGAKQDDEALTWHIASAPPQTEAKRVSPQIRMYLVERAGILALLLSRYHSESYLATKEIPEGVEFVNRVRTLAVARKESLEAAMEPDESVLLMAPEGQWDVNANLAEAMKWSEQLRLLRWTLQVDLELLSLRITPCPDFRQGVKIIDDLALMREEESCLGAGDLLGPRHDPYGGLLAGQLPLDYDKGPLALRAAQRSQYAAYLAYLLEQNSPIAFSVYKQQDAAENSPSSA